MLAIGIYSAFGRYGTLEIVTWVPDWRCRTAVTRTAVVFLNGVEFEAFCQRCELRAQLQHSSVIGGSVFVGKGGAVITQRRHRDNSFHKCSDVSVEQIRR